MQPTNTNRVFTVYPNPAVIGSDIKISFHSAGKYAIQLLDISGKIYTSQSADTKKNVVISLPVPEAAMAGAYLISVTQAGSKTVQTEKIMLQ